MNRDAKSLTILVTTLLLGCGSFLIADGVDDAYAVSHNLQWEFLDIPNTINMTEGDSFSLFIINTDEVSPTFWGTISYNTRPYSESISWATTSSDATLGATLIATNIPSGTYIFTAKGDSDEGYLSQDLKIVVAPLLVIPYTAPSGNAIANLNWSHTFSTLPGVNISISGADWLSVNGNSVYGVPPDSGDYVFTVTLSKNGYATRTETVTLTVVSELIVLNSPSSGAIMSVR